jgi:hypothetical protein
LRQRIVQRPVAVHASVQAGKEVMKVQATLLATGTAWKKPSSSQLLPRPTEPCRYRLRGCRRSSRQLFGHAVDHPSLAVTQGVTAFGGLVPEMRHQRAGLWRRAAQALIKLAQGLESR